VQGVLEKLREEPAELDEEVRSGEQKAAEEEMGDLLFTTANLARHIKVDPELALRDASAKVRRRFAAMEAFAPKPLEEMTAVELDALWTQSKRAERRA
ncbi:MAG: MazG nucleotide pyrophosphohydrolase domain-containing protein, partial [Acidobacteriaceae bacterium]